MKMTYFIAFLLLAKFANAQIIEWEKTADWRLYNVSTSRATQFNPDSVAYYKYTSIPTDTIHHYLSDLIQIPLDQTQGIAWMGDYWATCNFQDSLRFLRISRYGGFFEDMRSGIYFEIPINLRSTWQLYLTHAFILAKQYQNVR